MWDFLGDCIMTGLPMRFGAEIFRPLVHKLRSLGSAESDAELDAVLKRIKVRPGARRGEDIMGPGRAPRQSTVLLEGVACLYERLRDGNRQIYAFQYPGDFCGLHHHVLPDSSNEVAVAALTGCSIGIIEHRDLDQLIAQYPSLGLALWRSTMLEASIFRKRLLNVGRQPALQRVAHLLCEQLARREAAGFNSLTIPLTQMDLADAAGLSIVHINRTFQELRELGLLSKTRRAIEVVNRERLVRLANFDGHYLNMPQVLSRWQVSIEHGSTTRFANAGLVPRPPTSARLLSKPAAQKGLIQATRGLAPRRVASTAQSDPLKRDAPEYVEMTSCT